MTLMVSRLQTIKTKLFNALQEVNYISIEHVDSTSVPLLPAKPIIDIDITITTFLSQSEP